MVRVCLGRERVTDRVQAETKIKSAVHFSILNEIGAEVYIKIRIAPPIAYVMLGTYYEQWKPKLQSTMTTQEK